MDGFKSYYTPKDIEKATGKSGKSIRGRLRKRYPRPSEQLYTNWELTYSQYITEVNYWKDSSKSF